MSFIGSAIIAACIGASGQAHEACVKSLDAGSIQSGIRRDADQFEDNLIRYINMRLENELSEKQRQTLAVTGFFLKVAKDQKVSFRAPTLGMCKRIDNEITPSSYSVKFGWDF